MFSRILVRTVMAASVLFLSGSAHAIEWNPFANFHRDRPAGAQLPPLWSDPWVDPVEYGPEVAHPIAIDCAASDAPCVAAYDERVLTLALMMSSPGMCQRAVRPEVCESAYQLTVGDVAVPARWAGLDDGCTWVEQIDSGVARLFQLRTGERRKALAAPGWKHATFIGTCDLAQFTADVVTPAAVMPWVSQ